MYLYCGGSAAIGPLSPSDPQGCALQSSLLEVVTFASKRWSQSLECVCAVCVCTPCMYVCSMCVCMCVHVCMCVSCVCAPCVYVPWVYVSHVCVPHVPRVCVCVCVDVCTLEGGLYFRPSHLSIHVRCFKHTTAEVRVANRSFCPSFHSVTWGDEPDSSIRLT